MYDTEMPGYSYSPLNESISYENTRKRRSGNCTHSLRRLTFKALSGDTSVDLPHDLPYPNAIQVHKSVGSPIGWMNNPQAYLSSTCGPIPSIDDCKLPFLFPESDVDALCARAIQEMTPSIKSDLSLLVTLAELRDVKSLLTGPVKIARDLLSGSGGPLRRLLRATGSTILHDKFVNKQTLNDVLGIMSVFSTVESRLAQLRKEVNRVQVSHWSNGATPLEYSFETQPAHSGNTTKYCSVQAKGIYKFTCTMRYTYDIVDALGNPIVADDLLRHGAYLDALGIYLNPAIVWDLVPFSFVVDYFLSVGDWLESFAVKNLSARVNILDLCYSIKKAGVSRWYAAEFMRTTIDGDPSQGMRQGQFQLLLDEKSYIRRRFFPRPDWLHSANLSLGDPSWGQWITMASLVSANLR